MKDQKELFKSFLKYGIIFIIIQLSLFFSVTFIDGKVALVIAVLWLLSTIIFYILSKELEGIKKMYSIINAVIAGIAMSSYYTLKSVELYNPILGLTIIFICMFLSYKLIVISNKIKTITIINIVLSIIGMIIAVDVWIKINSSLGSFMVFTLCIYMCLFIGLYLSRNGELNCLDIVNKASLFMFAGVLIIVITALSEGKALDFLDICWGDGTKKKKNKQC